MDSELLPLPSVTTPSDPTDPALVPARLHHLIQDMAPDNFRWMYDIQHRCPDEIMQSDVTDTVVLLYDMHTTDHTETGKTACDLTDIDCKKYDLTLTTHPTDDETVTSEQCPASLTGETEQCSPVEAVHSPVPQTVETEPCTVKADVTPTHPTDDDQTVTSQDCSASLTGETVQSCAVEAVHSPVPQTVETEPCTVKADLTPTHPTDDLSKYFTADLWGTEMDIQLPDTTMTTNDLDISQLTVADISDCEWDIEMTAPTTPPCDTTVTAMTDRRMTDSMVPDSEWDIDMTGPPDNKTDSDQTELPLPTPTVPTAHDDKTDSDQTELPLPTPTAHFSHTVLGSPDGTVTAPPTSTPIQGGMITDVTFSDLTLSTQGTQLTATPDTPDIRDGEDSVHDNSDKEDNGDADGGDADGGDADGGDADGGDADGGNADGGNADGGDDDGGDDDGGDDDSSDNDSSDNDSSDDDGSDDDGSDDDDRKDDSSDDDSTDQEAEEWPHHTPMLNSDGDWVDSSSQSTGHTSA